jgi:hypothetical protein
MTEAMKRLIELDKKKAEIKKFYEDMAEAVKAVAIEIGVDKYFQDEEGTVYKIVTPKGKYVHFEPLDYVRTKRADEKRGELSVKEAEEAGFTLPAKS